MPSRLLLAGGWLLAGCHRQNTRRCAFIVLLQPGTTDAVFRALCRECTGVAWLSLLLTCTLCAANAAVSEPANRLPWLHFAAPVYSRDDMARAKNRRPGCAQSLVPGPCLLPLPTCLPACLVDRSLVKPAVRGHRSRPGLFSLRSNYVSVPQSRAAIGWT